MANITYLENFKQVQGFNQLVTITGNSALMGFSTDRTIRVSDYQIGVNQTGEAPDYVTGNQDRTAWRKGPIETQGDLSFPFTLPQDGGAGTGLSMFKAAANLASNPNESFSIRSSLHPTVGGCKINQASIECSAGGPIESRATVWGVVVDDQILQTQSYGSTEVTEYSRTLNDSGRNLGDGELTTGDDDLDLEQIPMWDQVRIVGAPADMLLVGFSLQIDNRLQRYYTMGDGSTENYSPFGMNASSIAPNQRMITGSITWQSAQTGKLTQLVGVGIRELNIYIGPPGSAIQLRLRNVMFNAQPPRITPSDRVTVESSFTALGANEESFDALEIIE